MKEALNNKTENNKNSINNLNKLEPPSTAGSSSFYNGDNTKKNLNMTDLIKHLAHLITNEKYKGFRSEDPQEFLNQFIEIEDQYDSEKKLRIIKSKLKKKALSWYEAIEGFEVTNYEEFKTEFTKGFIKTPEEKTKKKWFGN